MTAPAAHAASVWARVLSWTVSWARLTDAPPRKVPSGKPVTMPWPSAQLRAAANQASGLTSV